MSEASSVSATGSFMGRVAYLGLVNSIGIIKYNNGKENEYIGYNMGDLLIVRIFAPIPKSAIKSIMQKTVFFLLLSLFSCAPNTQAQTKIDAAQTEAMLSADTAVQLVDLRTPAEVQQTGKIAGAKHINFNSPDFQAQMAQLDQEKPVIVYCAGGGRSGKATTQMEKMGFKKIYDYSGGMNDWKSKGKKTVQ